MPSYSELRAKEQQQNVQDNKDMRAVRQAILKAAVRGDTHAWIALAILMAAAEIAEAIECH